MVISALALDPVTKSPIVVLKEIDGERTLPIWIGFLEAQAIASELEGIKFSRPMTHDLLKIFFDLTQVKVKRIEVCDLKDSTYFALIHISHKNNAMAIDARPSDALALSLRVGAPIFVADSVIKSSKQIDTAGEPEDRSDRGKQWTEILKSIDPEDFGNT
jgi:hypothetical protein